MLLDDYKCEKCKKKAHDVERTNEFPICDNCGYTMSRVPDGTKYRWMFRDKKD